MKDGGGEVYNGECSDGVRGWGIKGRVWVGLRADQSSGWNESCISRTTMWWKIFASSKISRYVAMCQCAGKSITKPCNFGPLAKR